MNKECFCIKSKKVVASFFNSKTDESEDIEMIKCGEDSDAFIFSCEGNVKKYNAAYFTYDNKNSKKFAFNRCVSGWEKTGDGFKPYTNGAVETSPYFERSQNEVNNQNPESRPDDCLYIPEQVRSMTAETEYKAIVVAVSTYGDMTFCNRSVPRWS